MARRDAQARRLQHTKTVQEEQTAGESTDQGRRRKGAGAQKAPEGVQSEASRRRTVTKGMAGQSARGLGEKGHGEMHGQDGGHGGHSGGKREETSKSKKLNG